MQCWWVNHNQTHAAEVGEGYLWCPYRKANGHRNHFYETMRGVQPGDVVLSCHGSAVRNYGVAQTYKYSFPRPAGFDSRWAEWGWRCDVAFHPLRQAVPLGTHADELRTHLRASHHPIQSKKNRASQSCYLAEITGDMALEIARLAGDAALREAVVRPQPPNAAALDGIAHKYGLLDDVQARMIELRGGAASRRELLHARYGIGAYRDEVARIEPVCRTTDESCSPALSACHMKPWRESDDAEKMAGENGLLLPVGQARLFSYGFFSFASDGAVIKSRLAEDDPHLKDMVPANALRMKGFSSGQEHFLEHHRNCVLLNPAS